MSDYPAVPDMEFSEPWHTHLAVEVKEYIEALNTRIQVLENVQEEQEEDLINYVRYASAFHLESGDGDVLSSDFEVYSHTFDTEAGNTALITFQISITRTDAGTGAVLPHNFYINGEKVGSELATYNFRTTNQVRLQALIKTKGKTQVSANFESSAGTFTYDTAGENSVSLIEIKE